MDRQRATQSTGGYRHSAEEPIGQVPVGQEIHPGGQQAVPGEQPQAGRQRPQGTGTGTDEMQADPASSTGGHGHAGQSTTGTRHVHSETQPQQAGVAEYVDRTLADALTPPMHAALDDAVEAAQACEWCADQCIDEGPEMARCIRLCRDVGELARLYATFVTRNSIFGPDVARTFVVAAEECANECRQHPHEHCQACARVLDRAVETTRDLLATIGGSSLTGQSHA